MVDDRELRRRAQPLIDRPPYEPLPIAEVHRRAATRNRKARAQIAAAAVCVVAVVATAVGVVLSNGGSNGHNVAVRTTGTAAPITVPASTSITDLHFTPIEGPNGDNRVELYAAGDEFLAVEGDQGFERAWIGDASGRWRAMLPPAGLRGTQIGNVVQLRDRVAVVGVTNRGTAVFEGLSLDRLQRSPWTTETAGLPSAIHPAPPPGRGILVSGSVDASAVGENGIVLVGTVSAQLDRALLPKSVRDAYVRHLGRIDVRDGRVVAWIYNDKGTKETVFDEPASSLGITADEARYLARSDESRTEMAVWTAGWGEPLQQGPATGIDPYRRYGNFSVTQVSDGFVLTAPTDVASEVWWSRDGRSWQHLAAPPGGAGDSSWLVEVGSRWVIPSAGVVSYDEGRSWVPNDIAGNLTTHPGAGLLGANGSSEFGLIGSSNAIDASTVTVFAGRLLYSPDGMHWTSVTLADALGFDANIPTIAVGDRAAILETGVRAPGAVAQRFWRVTIGA